jgi:hypothetical protein
MLVVSLVYDHDQFPLRPVFFHVAVRFHDLAKVEDTIQVHTIAVRGDSIDDALQGAGYMNEDPAGTRLWAWEGADLQDFWSTGVFNNDRFHDGSLFC